MPIDSPQPPRRTTHPHRAAAPPDLIVDLSIDFDDSEYEDVDTEFDV